MKPEITETSAGYTFIWDDLEIIVNRPISHRDGRVTGEVIIKTSAKGFSSILQPPTQMNFSAERTRKELIKGLTERYSKWEWQTIIDQLAWHIQEITRRGEPAVEIDINADEQFVPLTYLIEPILQEKLPTVIYGDKGVNKSTLALLFSICLNLPWYDNPYGFDISERRIPTLFLDWEQEESIIKYYAKRLQIGMGLPYFTIPYRRCLLPLTEDVERIHHWIRETNSEVVIIDSLGAAAGGSELNKPEAALPFFAALRKLKVTSLILAQNTKDAETKKKTIFGSTFFTYYARTIFELVKSKESTDDNVSVALIHRGGNYSAPVSPLGFNIIYNGVNITINKEEVNMREFIHRLSTSQRILDLLKLSPKTMQEIIEELDITRANAGMTIGRLKQKGLILKKDDKWGMLYEL